KVSAKGSGGSGLLDDGDGLDVILVQRHKIFIINRVVDGNVRQIDEGHFLVVEQVGHPVAHGRHEDIAHIDRIDGADSNADLLAIHHRDASLCEATLAFAAREFHAPAKFPVLVLAHLLLPLLDDTRHEPTPSLYTYCAR